MHIKRLGIMLLSAIATAAVFFAIPAASTSATAAPAPDCLILGSNWDETVNC
jgi:hypothetical protein